MTQISCAWMEKMANLRSACYLAYMSLMSFAINAVHQLMAERICKTKKMETCVSF